MARRKRDVSIPDELVNELFEDYREPGDLLGESGTFNTLSIILRLFSALYVLVELRAS
jgi:hypothetical protein